MNSKIKLILGTFLFIILIGGAYILYNNLSQDYKIDNQIVKQKESDESIDNEIEETEESEENDEEVKIPAPDFIVYDYEGEEVRLSDFIGKPVVLNFWASWCPPCKSEMPHFNKIYSEVKDDVVFMMVDLVDGQRETKEKGEKYIKDNGYSFPVYYDTKQEAAYTYQISSIPTTLFIDKDGNVVLGYKGAIDEDTLISGIELIK